MTDVHFRESDNALASGVRAQQLGTAAPMQMHHIDPKLRDVNSEATEMAAFEKGRMQGEMEAIRRMEAENQTMQLKQFPVDTAATQMQRPDVLEINRLTWLQRTAAFLGEAAALAYIVLGLVWMLSARTGEKQGFSWSNDYAGNNIGSVTMWNVGFLTSLLGLFFLSNAILMYRILPLNTNAWFNRGLYCFNYSAAITCFIITLVAIIKTHPDMTLWGVDGWCFVMALSSVVFHGLYSMARTLMEPARAVTYEKWAETNNSLTNRAFESPEQRRDHSVANQAGRTVYTPAPHFPSMGRNMPHTNANVGAQVPAAPANAPRWAENPNTHAEHYFLMPRAKWGVTSFVGIGATILMILTGVEYSLAAGRNNWAQDDGSISRVGGLTQNSQEAFIIGSIGLLILSSVLLIAYAAMPPRTTLVKNGILQDQTRRASISHNAETRLGHSMV